MIDIAAVMAAAAIAVAAGVDPHVASAPRCDAPMRATWSKDSTVALCLPDGFTERRPLAWARVARNGSVSDAISFSWIALPLAIDTMGPARRSADSQAAACSVDCLRATRSRSWGETIDGHLVQVEYAFVSGGIAGWNDRPTFQARWTNGTRKPLSASGWAADQGMLDTLLTALRSIQLAKALRND